MNTLARPEVLVKMNEIPHWSWSSIEKIMQCPKSWFAKYIAKLEQPTSEAASFGSQLDQELSHRMGLTPAVEGKLEGIDTMADFYMEQPGAWQTATTSQEKITIEPHEWEIYAETYNVPYLIKRPYIGYLDFSKTEGLKRTIMDVKTSSRRGFKPGWALQTLLYSLAKRAQEIEIHLMVRTATPGFQRFKLRPTEQSLTWALSTIGYYAEQGEALAKAKSSEFLPTVPGFWCSWCPHNIGCEASYYSAVTEVSG